jgi:hypothetical protein
MSLLYELCGQYSDFSVLPPASSLSEFQVSVRNFTQITSDKGVSLRGPGYEIVVPHCARENDRRLGMWMARLDVTVRQIKVKDRLFPASPGPYTIVSHLPEIAAGWAASVVMANGPAGRR